MGFTGNYGSYHRGYDDHYRMATIGDPSFEDHTALSRVWGATTLRLANADILPFDYGACASRSSWLRGRRCDSEYCVLLCDDQQPAAAGQ